MSAYWQIPIIWPGATAYVVGGGPSLRDLNWSALRGRRVVGSNNAMFEHSDVVDFGVFGDVPFWNKYTERILGSRSIIVTNVERPSAANLPDAIQRVRRKTHEWSRGQRALCWLGNTGALAVNLAARLGAKRVVLLGFDMCRDAHANSNWYDGNRKPPTETHFNRFRGTFPIVVEGCREEGVELVNANEQSTLGCGIPVVSREEALAW